MAAYAMVGDVQARMLRPMSESEQRMCATMLEDAAVIIDAYNVNATPDAKMIVSCRIVIRALGDGESGSAGNSVPVGATQGSWSGLGYAQSWAITGGGAAGEMYLGRMEKKLLGVGNSIGSYSPVQELVPTAPGC